MSVLQTVQKAEKISFLDQSFIQLEETKRLLEASENSFFKYKIVTDKGFIHPWRNPEWWRFWKFSNFRRKLKSCPKIQCIEKFWLIANTHPADVIYCGSGPENYIIAAWRVHIAYKIALWKSRCYDEHSAEVFMPSGSSN